MISLNNVPETLIYLDLSNNYLTGSLNNFYIPESIILIDLAFNNFVGNLNFNFNIKH